MQFLLLFSLTSFLSLFQLDGWRGDVQQTQAQQEALCVGVKVKIKAFLQGPYTAGASTMTTSLSASLPPMQPYSTAPYATNAGTGQTGFTYYTSSAVVMGGGLETATAAVLTGSNGVNTGANAIVDWVFVELRSNASTVVETRAALLKANGDVVDTDGVTELTFTGVACASFFVSLHHRNHLAVTTSAAVALTNDANTTALVDFSATTTTIGGAVDGRSDITLTGAVAGKALTSGDTNHDNTVAAADRNNTWNDRTLTGYQRSDCSMNGTVDAADRNFTWNNRNKSNL